MRRRPGARWCTRCWSGSSTTRRWSVRPRAPVPWWRAEWERLSAAKPELAELFAEEGGAPVPERVAQWLAEAGRLVERWFTLEDPTRLEPAGRELFVEATLDSGLTLRGIIDRVDVAPTGEVRLDDYKTGKAPRPEYAADALFRMKFYALALWRLRGAVPPAVGLSRQRGRAGLRAGGRAVCGPWSASCSPCGRRSGGPR